MAKGAVKKGESLFPKPRRKTRTVRLGSLRIGAEYPVRVQSMCNTPTEQLKKTTAQILSLESMGCDVIRVAANTRAAVAAIAKIRPRISIPLVADIHFDIRLALGALEAGADGIRINPGNVKAMDLDQLASALNKRRDTALRIGINSGSLEPELLKKYGHPTAMAMAESAVRALKRFERAGIDNIKISIKSPDLDTTIGACRIVACETDCPLHLGITEAGTPFTGAVRSAVGLGVLLSEGIGDTIRVSLSGPPEDEVRAGNEILRSLGLRPEGVRVIACPTCGRTLIDVIGLAARVEAAVAGMPGPLRVAVMGCQVNGPGEAREADVGLAGGKGRGLIFKKGEPVRWAPKEEMFGALMDEIKALLKE